MDKKYIITILAAIVLAVLGWWFFSRDSKKMTEDSSTQTQQQTADNQTNNNQDQVVQNETSTAPGSCVRNYKTGDEKKVTLTGTEKFVTLSVAGFGDIKIEVNKIDAPKTSENFLRLAKSGFYDCLSFHRVAKGFVIQGGDPEGTGAGGPGYNLPAEIKLKHVKGAIAMARQGDQVNPKRESSGSQFYIALEELPMLDGQYTVFGNVVSGMDVVTKIGNVQIVGSNDGPPVEDVIISKAVIS